MNSARGSLIVPILLIAIGSGWLLTGLEIFPSINWLWTGSLAGLGVLVFALTGIDKVSIVVGTMFILASFFSVLRQNGQLTLDIEIPLLVISAGLLQLVARLPAIPPPDWIADEGDRQEP